MAVDVNAELESLVLERWIMRNSFLKCFNRCRELCRENNALESERQVFVLKDKFERLQKADRDIRILSRKVWSPEERRNDIESCERCYERMLLLEYDVKQLCAASRNNGECLSPSKMVPIVQNEKENLPEVRKRIQEEVQSPSDVATKRQKRASDEESVGSENSPAIKISNKPELEKDSNVSKVKVRKKLSCKKPASNKTKIKIRNELSSEKPKRKHLMEMIGYSYEVLEKEDENDEVLCSTGSEAISRSEEPKTKLDTESFIEVGEDFLTHGLEDENEGGFNTTGSGETSRSGELKKKHEGEIYFEKGENSVTQGFKSENENEREYISTGSRSMSHEEPRTQQEEICFEVEEDDSLTQGLESEVENIERLSSLYKVIQVKNEIVFIGTSRQEDLESEGTLNSAEMMSYEELEEETYDKRRLCSTKMRKLPLYIENDETNDIFNSTLVKNFKTRSERAWKFVQKFKNKSEAEDFIKNENTWAYLSATKTRHGAKRYFRCNKVRRRGPQCSAQIYILLDAFSEAVFLYQTIADHDHHLKLPAYIGLSEKVRDEIDRLEDLGVKPMAIMGHLNTLEDIVVPKMLQIRSYLANRRKRLKNFSALACYSSEGEAEADDVAALTDS